MAADPPGQRPERLPPDHHSNALRLLSVVQTVHGGIAEAVGRVESVTFVVRLGERTEVA